VDPTIEPPVAEEVPNESATATINDGTPTGDIDAPSTTLRAFPDLSPKIHEGEVPELTEQARSEEVPEGGGTTAFIALALAEEQAHDPSAEDQEKLLDLAGQQSTKADLKLMEVYGNSTYCNDGHHLHGGIKEDELWQRRYDHVVANSHKLYLPPPNKGSKGCGDSLHEGTAWRT
jgi:hypothetical protein